MAKSSRQKTSWTAGSGEMTFILPVGRTFTVDARHIDQPNTLCELADIAVEKLSMTEQAALAGMLESMAKTQPKEG